MRHNTVVLDTPEAIERHLGVAIEPAGFDDPAVRFVLCDGANQVLAHCHVRALPADLSAADCARALSVFVGVLADGGDGALLLALLRPGPPSLCPADGLWFRTAHEVCAEHRVRLLGVHVVTPHGQREVRWDDAL